MLGPCPNTNTICVGRFGAVGHLQSTGEGLTSFGPSRVWYASAV
jgi:hypothetical protein